MTPRFLVSGTGAGTAVTEVYHQLTKILSQLSEQDGSPSFSQIDALGGLSIAQAIKDPESTLKEVTISLRSDNSGAVLIQGLQSAPAPSFDVAGWNYDVAANVAASVILVIDGTGLSAELLADEVKTALRRVSAHHAGVSGVVLVGAEPSELPAFEVPVVSSRLTEESVKQITGPAETSVTPLAFQSDLIARAKANRKRIVLPEPEDPRVLRAAGKLLADEVTDLILIGNAEQVKADAANLGVDISAAQIVPTDDAQLREKYAEEFARLRAHKGVSLEDARAKLADVTYFATMMVQMGDADGMVSGAIHTTAETIVPAFQIIKTRPGVSLVSSAFLMLLADHVLVMGDCAVNTNPTAAQLAEIAASTAATAAAFGIDPKVALLSYSTGGSGSGADVDLVREATETLMKANPDLAVEGPIQYDAAVAPEVAATKAPNSAVAGQANVLIFPSLSAGNIAYKAVQRSANAVAVGPILQGLRKPVNDLSRGATVEDIVNTVAITAVQAQSEETN